MSKNIKVQLSKTLPNTKLEILLNSYTSLKSILSPNLSENNNSFMNSLMELIISQLQIFIKLLSLNEETQTYKLLNSNNQYLSKQIAALYEFPRYNVNTRKSVNSASEKERNDNINRIYNKKESYSLEEKNEFILRKDSDNLDFDFNKNNTGSKKEEQNNDAVIDEKNESNKNNSEVINNNNIKKDLHVKTPKHFEYKEKKDKFIKINKTEKHKNELIRSINFANKEKVKEKEKYIKPKLPKNIKKVVTNNNNITMKEKDTKIQSKKNFFSPKDKIKSKKYLNASNSKINDSSFQLKNNNNNNISNANFKEKTYKVNRNKSINESAKEPQKKSKSKNKIESNNKKFVRKDRKSKTVIYQTIQIPYLIDISSKENSEDNNNYISITFSNRILERVKTPKVLKRKYKANTNKHVKVKTSTSNNSFKKGQKSKLRSPEYFSLDAFLIPQTGEGDEKFFFTKKGNVIINKNQKDILEDYVNNYLFDEEDAKSSGTEKTVKDKIIKNMKSKKNIKYVIKGTSKHYNLKDVTDVLQILPNTYSGKIDDFYLKRKRASIFDRGIFKICHKVIDNYKKLEGKEDIFNNKKTSSNSKNKKNERQRNNSNKNLYKYKNKTEALYNKVF